MPRGLPILTGIPVMKYSRITPNIYVGPQFRQTGKRRLEALGIKASLNLRAEFDDRVRQLEFTQHCYLPTEDDHAPTLAQLEAGDPIHSTNHWPGWKCVYTLPRRDWARSNHDCRLPDRTRRHIGSSHLPDKKVTPVYQDHAIADAASQTVRGHKKECGLSLCELFWMSYSAILMVGAPFISFRLRTGVFKIRLGGTADRATRRRGATPTVRPQSPNGCPACALIRL